MRPSRRDAYGHEVTLRARAAWISAAYAALLEANERVLACAARADDGDRDAAREVATLMDAMVAPLIFIGEELVAARESAKASARGAR